jgi:hypothetical protein
LHVAVITTTETAIHLWWHGDRILRILLSSPLTTSNSSTCSSYGGEGSRRRARVFKERRGRKRRGRKRRGENKGERGSP